MPQLVLLLTVFLAPSPALAEVSDKIPTIPSLWLQGLLIGIVGFVLSRMWLRVGLALLPVSLILAWGAVAIITDPYVGPAAIAEQGAAYAIAVWGSVVIQVALHGCGLLLGWRNYRRHHESLRT